jgi:putative FmdB family regulatory protein
MGRKKNQRFRCPRNQPDEEATMPIFDYACQSCPCQFEQRVERPRQRVRCPRCDSSSTRRLPATFALRGRCKAAPSLAQAGSRAPHHCGDLHSHQ